MYLIRGLKVRVIKNCTQIINWVALRNCATIEINGKIYQKGLSLATLQSFGHSTVGSSCSSNDGRLISTSKWSRWAIRMMWFLSFSCPASMLQHGQLMICWCSEPEESQDSVDTWMDEAWEALVIGQLLPGGGAGSAPCQDVTTQRCPTQSHY